MFLRVVVYCLFSLFSHVALAKADSLYVFIPTEMRANKLEQQIDAYCSDVDVTVFGRAKDFHKKLKASPPNAILSLRPVIKRSQKFDEAVLGLKNGLQKETYLLVSVNTPIQHNELPNTKLGVVDLLGRTPMRQFVEGALDSAVKLKRVTKVEDLLPLITFGAVDAILLSESQFKTLKVKSKLPLVASDVQFKIGLASAALTEKFDKKRLQNCLLAFDKQLNSTLGVDQWQTL